MMFEHTRLSSNGRLFSRLALLVAGTLCSVARGELHAQAASLVVSPLRPQPGAIVRLTLQALPSRTDSIVGVTASLAGEPLHFKKIAEGKWHAIGGMPVDATAGPVAQAMVVWRSGLSDTVSTQLFVPPQPATRSSGRRRSLSVASRFTERPDAATEARIARETAAARAAGKRAHESAPMWTQPFIRPRASLVTSRFGSGRLFNGTVTSRHLGVDFRGAVGEPVHAANRGMVTLADNFFLAGGVVYIDHGGGLMTGYFHLSETLVKPGDTVARGQRIGAVGATGRVTGPHLHWSARYGALPVNPLDLMSLTRLWLDGAAPPERR